MAVPKATGHMAVADGKRLYDVDLVAGVAKPLPALPSMYAPEKIAYGPGDQLFAISLSDVHWSDTETIPFARDYKDFSESRIYEGKVTFHRNAPEGIKAFAKANNLQVENLTLVQALRLNKNEWQVHQAYLAELPGTDAGIDPAFFSELTAYRWVRDMWDLYPEQQCRSLPIDSQLQQIGFEACNEARLQPILNSGPDFGRAACLAGRYARFIRTTDGRILGTCACKWQESDKALSDDNLGLSFLWVAKSGGQSAAHYVPALSDAPDALLRWSFTRFRCLGTSVIFNRLVVVESCDSNPCEGMSENHLEVLSVELQTPGHQEVLHTGEFIMFWPCES